MRKKYYFIFILLFISILGIYLLCITHINIFITDYENKFVNYENKFNAESQYNNIIYTLLHDSNLKVSTMYDLNEILSSDYLMSFLSYFFELTKEETAAYLQKYFRQKMANTIYTEYYNAPVIYITSGDYSLTFTLDGKNIYYNKYLNGDTCPKANISANGSSIDLISTNVNNIMNTTGIKKNIGFDITSIRKAYTSEYYELYGSVYFIEDKTHNIKITYQLDCDVAYVLQLGFGELDNY